MANILFGYGVLAEAATLTGGSWETDLPLPSLQSREIFKVARTTDANDGSAVAIIDFGSVKPWRLIGVVNHNLEIDAQYRVTAANDSGFSTDVVYSGELTDVYPEVYAPEALEWEDDNWWSGKYSAEEIEGQVLQFEHIPPSIVRSRYVKLELFDSGNSAGFIQFGYLALMAGWQGIRTIDVGAAHGLETATEIGEAVGGSEVIDEQPQWRTYRATMSQMDEDEAFGRAWQIMKRVGTGQPIYVVPDPDDIRNSLRNNFLGRFTQLNPVVHRQAGRMSVDFEIREWTA